MDPLNTPLADQPRFAAYVATLSDVLGHADRVAPLKAYCTGLLLPGARKSIEPMAARIAPARVQATHQALHHFVAKGDWSDTALLARVRATVLPMIESQGPIQAWIVDDTGFPKKGRHSVGVWRQYCGQVGKQENCQVAVTLSLANAQASLPVAYRLYLPEAWAQDPERRTKAGVPEAICFQTKPEIALDQIRAAQAEQMPPGLVLADAGYGIDTAFRTALTALGLHYSLGIQSSTSLWPPGTAPLPPKAWSGRGRPPTRVRRSPDQKPLSAEKLARSLPEAAWQQAAWQQVKWRAGTNGLLASRFAAVRARPAHRDERRHEPRAEEWVLIEWPQGEAAPTKYCDPAARDVPGRARQPDQTALAHRAGLSRAEAGDRARPLRGAGLAWLSSSRQLVHRRLRVPGLRAGPVSPLSVRVRQAPNTCPTLRLQTPRRPRSGPSVTCLTPSRPYA
jgi:SRSO17 transposase